jgi:hypothetical protein
MTDKTAPKSDTVADAIPAQQKEALSQAFTASMSSLNDMSGKSKQAVQAVADSGTMAAKTGGRGNCGGESNGHCKDAPGSLAVADEFCAVGVQRLCC